MIECLGPPSAQETVMSILLASASPRRTELLSLTGIDFRIVHPQTVEVAEGDEAPERMAARLAGEKARSVEGQAEWGEIIVAADTIVARGGRSYGKPIDAAQARWMLKDLQADGHQVVTSIVILDRRSRRIVQETCVSQVPMRPLQDDEIDAYVHSGAAMDKAGAYGIQDAPLRPVDMEAFRECYANVMGLPLCHLVRGLRQIGLHPPGDVPAACQRHTGYDCPVFASILETS